jgi:PEP-CTERM motif
MKIERLTLSAFVCVSSAAFVPGSAIAKDVKITKNNQGTVIAWTARFDEVQNGNTVDLSFDAASATITKTVTFKSPTPVSILFFEDEVATADSDNTEGIRILMNEVVTNKTPSDWKGFEQELLNTTPVCDGGQSQKSNACKVTTAGRTPATRDIGTAVHPQFPHFHTIAATKFDPFADATPGGANAKSFIALAGGPVKIDDTWRPRAIVLHNVEVQGFRRQFALTEVPLPVPEPATWLMAIGGIVGVAGYARMRRRAT